MKIYLVKVEAKTYLVASHSEEKLLELCKTIFKENIGFHFLANSFENMNEGVFASD